LEAISLVTLGRSFRTQHLSELIAEGKSYFYLEAEIIRDHVSQRIKLFHDGKTKRLHLNATTYTTFTPLLGICPSIISVPEDVGLITNSPIHRRRFLNIHLAQSDPLYVHHLSRFWRAMKQRNHLLKLKQLQELDCWELEMATSAAYLFKARKALLSSLNSSVTDQSKRLSENADEANILFQPSYAPIAQDYTKQLQKMRKKELDLGLTLQGPHRDELLFLINAKPAKTFASEGQKKTMVSALRLAEWQNLAGQMECFPLMGIDDFGNALDPMRQQHLANQLKSMKQLFLTTSTPLEIFPDARFLHIHAGEILSLK